ncbi:hypothetical protein E2C01_003356 [Portunus trituberculatus]|uniref:Uncharacterized protein n=1 Tax=Portunus trituberculatus TaxID=210409 RepID=A0A5B7CQV6_PORTR|nr:hypothetical protein [Portunus trituberculatus]
MAITHTRTGGYLLPRVSRMPTGYCFDPRTSRCPYSDSAGVRVVERRRPLNPATSVLHLRYPARASYRPSLLLFPLQQLSFAREEVALIHVAKSDTTYYMHATGDSEPHFYREQSIRRPHIP